MYIYGLVQIFHLIIWLLTKSYRVENPNDVDRMGNKGTMKLQDFVHLVYSIQSNLYASIASGPGGAMLL